MSQGNFPQLKQYLFLPCLLFSQFFILQKTRVFGLTLSSPRHPGHAFFALAYARQRRQFIPQGAISAADIVFVFAGFIVLMSVFPKKLFRNCCFETRG